MRRHFSSLLAALPLAACFGDSSNPIITERDARIRWVYELGTASYYGSPALSADGLTAYLGTSEPPASGRAALHSLRAVDVANGTQRWSFSLGAAEVRSSPAVAPDGSITVLLEERSLSGGFVKSEVVRVSPTGGLVWRREIGVPGERNELGFSSPAIAADGSVYVASDSLYKLSPTGQILWSRFHTGEDLRASPVIGADGSVYFAARGIPLTALHPDSGRVLWDASLGAGQDVVASPAIGSDGTIYVATANCVLHAVAANGTPSWTYNAGGGGTSCSIRSSPAVAADGTILFGTVDRLPRPVLFAIRSDGVLRWTHTPGDLPVDVAAELFEIYSSPAVGSDGVVYFGHEYNRIYAVDLFGGTQRWLVKNGIEAPIGWSSPVLTASGVLLVNDEEGRLYALTTESLGLQGTAPWPRFRGSNRGAGRR